MAATVLLASVTGQIHPLSDRYVTELTIGLMVSDGDDGVKCDCDEQKVAGQITSEVAVWWL